MSATNIVQLLSAIFLLFLLSCSVEPKPIDYNADQCHACKMMISDSRFGSELVTTKGKVYMYDAIECLVPEVVKNGQDHYALLLVSNFNVPNQLIDATTSTFLISKQRPSPMGGNLSAYETEQLAKEAFKSTGGEVLSWSALLTKYQK